MKSFRPGAGITIFLIFFGIALLDAVREFNVWRMAFWIVMGAIFLLLDIRRKKV
jgi:hypothetical protein